MLQLISFPRLWRSHWTKVNPAAELRCDWASAVASFALDANCKMRRMKLFNGREGLALRLRVPGRKPSTASNHYCALCGRRKHRKRPNRKARKGHRFPIACNPCKVNLSLPVYPGLKKSCWPLCYFSKILTLSDTLRYKWKLGPRILTLIAFKASMESEILERTSKLIILV